MTPTTFPPHTSPHAQAVNDPHNPAHSGAPRAGLAGAVISRRSVGLALAGAPALLAGEAVLSHGSGFTPVAHAEPSDDSTDDPALKQTVSENEEIVKGENVVLDAGHVDIGPRLLDGEWILAMRDDTNSPQKWRLPSDVVLQVHDAGKLPVPDGDEYAFLKAEPGTEVYAVPQTEVSGVVWLGWNTQDPAVVKATPEGVTLRLTKVEGPGEFSLFLQPGNFAPPQILAEGSKLASSPAEVFVEINTHTHANWVFTKPGVYVVDIEAVAKAGGGKKYSDSGRFRFAVGDGTSVEEALAAGRDEDAAGGADGGGKQHGTEPGAASGTAAGGASQDGADANKTAADDSDDSTALPWIVAGGAAAALAVGGGGYAMQRSKARTAAAEARDSAAARGRTGTRGNGTGDAQ